MVCINFSHHLSLGCLLQLFFYWLWLWPNAHWVWRFGLGCLCWLHNTNMVLFLAFHCTINFLAMTSRWTSRNHLSWSWGSHLEIKKYLEKHTRIHLNICKKWMLFQSHNWEIFLHLDTKLSFIFSAISAWSSLASTFCHYPYLFENFPREL